MSRTLVIGDIHGGFRALKQVIERAEVVEEDHLIFLGDYVDGWSESAQTIEYLIELQDRNRCIFLLGNHDQLCRDWLETNDALPMWLGQGGAETVASYASYGPEERKEHLEFFKGMLEYFKDLDNRLFVHAGFTNMHGVGYEYFSKMFYWDRTLWEMALSLDPSISPEDSRYPNRLRHYKNIYIGHTPVTRLGQTIPVKAATVWNIDTGAAFKGPLTIMDVDTEDIWQSDPVHTLYPEEKGRN